MMVRDIVVSYYQPKRRKLLKTERQEVYNKCQGHCAYCGCEIEFKDMQVDHVIPWELYEAYRAIGEDIDTMANYLPACRSCNYYKNCMTVERFRVNVEKFHERLMRDSVTYKNAVRFGMVEPKPHKVEFYFEKLGIEVKK